MTIQSLSSALVDRGYQRTANKASRRSQFTGLRLPDGCPLTHNNDDDDLPEEN
jgi:hypothetical protein